MLNRRSVLLVEDSIEDAELTLTALGDVVNEVVHVRDGAEALDYLYRRQQFKDRAPDLPSVVFLDLKMPRVDGIEVLSTMKTDEQLKMIPVVMLTSSREEADLLRTYKLGVNAYMVKPVGFAAFMQAIRNAAVFWAVLNEPPPIPRPEPADD